MALQRNRIRTAVDPAARNWDVPVWNAVTPYLATTRRVIAFDTPGFGLTPPLSNGTAPTVAHLVDGLERSIYELGIELPVDIAGNSLGGSMALEAASRGIARSVAGSRSLVQLQVER